MSLATLLNKPCVLVRRSDSATLDAHGNPIEDVTETETVCDLQQVIREEPGDAGELSSSLWRLFLPVDTIIGTDDAVVVGGHVFELVGEPWNAKQGSPVMWHVEATVRRTAGGEEGS